MSAVDVALPRLKTEEGFRATAYKDTEGHITIGYGFNLDAGISNSAAAALLQAQLLELHDRLLTLAWYSALDDTRQSVCLDIAYNDGLVGLLHFINMIAALARSDWNAASDELLNSLAAKELPTRYNALAAILRSGSIS